jgi:hypothetical protein
MVACQKVIGKLKRNCLIQAAVGLAAWGLPATRIGDFKYIGKFRSSKEKIDNVFFACHARPGICPCRKVVPQEARGHWPGHQDFLQAGGGLPPKTGWRSS